MGNPRPRPMRLAEKLRQIRTGLGLSQTQMLERLGRESDVVVVDSPPLPEVAEAVALADACEAAVLCVRIGHRRPACRRAIPRLPRAPPRRTPRRQACTFTSSVGCASIGFSEAATPPHKARKHGIERDKTWAIRGVRGAVDGDDRMFGTISNERRDQPALSCSRTGST